MADYYQVKNQNIFTPPANISLGNTSNQYSNVYVQNNLVVGNVTVTSSTIIAPRVTTITYPGNDTAADPAGGQTITLTGSGFVVSASILINSIAVSVVSVVSSTIITFTSPANSSGSYVIYVVNPDGSTAIAVPGIQYSGIPTWTTAAGTLGSLYETASFTESVVATGDAPITYSVASGTLPPGATFNGNGTITGTSQLTASPTTYTFIVSATDAEQQDTNRSFSLTINTDVVTWTTPAANSTTTLGQNVASTTTLLATSAAGKAITYTANALPTGLSISGATVTGTPTVVGNTSSLFTATAATTGRTTTATINWAVTVSGDTYFPYTTLLLSGGTSTSTFIADASTNNFALAIAGDTKPNNFNPYTPGYYSNYFDGTGDYLSIANNAALNLGNNSWTCELWIYPTGNYTTYNTLFAKRNSASLCAYEGYLTPTNGYLGYYNGTLYSSTTAPNTGKWNHIAYVFDGTNIKIYLNGTQVLSSATSNADQAVDLYIGMYNYSGTPYDYYFGYISNFRLVKGVAVYTDTFTPPTAPLTATQSSGTNISAITGTQTSLLTCQSNRFLDNSTNLFAITVYGNTTVNPTTPFVPNTQYATYGSTYFDGTTDSLSVPSSTAFAFPSGVNFTAEGWVYLTSYSPGSVLGAALIGTTNGDVNGWFINLGQDINSLRITSNASGSWADNITVTAGNGVPLNTWTHIAFVRNGGSLVLYKNGVSVASMSGASAYNFTSPNNSAYIGYISDNIYTRYVTGYITDVRVVKGVAVYTSAFTPPSAPLTAITNTSLLTLQTNQPVNNSVFLDSSTNALAVTRVGNTSAGTFSPYGANWSNYFGSANYISAASNAAFGFGTGDFTVEAWVYPNAAYTTYNYIWATGVTNGLVFYVLGGVLYVRTYNGSDLLASSTAPALNTWTHVAVTRSGTTLRIFVNGVQTGTTTNSTDFATGSGIIGNDGTNAAPWLGYISNLRVVKGTAVYTANFTPSTTPLTPITNTSILTCQSNGLVDNSANAFAITKTGDVSVQRFSPFSPLTQTAISYSAYFDGTGDYLTVPSNAAFAMGTGDFTIECWINTSLVDAQDDVIIELRSSGATSTGFVFNMNQTGIGYRLNFYTDGASNLGSTVLNYNVWNHCAVTRSGTTVRLFSNGALSATFTKANNFSDTPVVYIGNSPLYSPSDTIGYISNLRVVKGTAVYTAAFTPSSAPLTAIAGTSLLTCQSPTFVDNSTNAFAITAYGNSQPRIQNPFGFTNTAAAYSAATYGGSAYFDGTGDYLSVPTATPIVLSGTVWTIECWCYLTSSSFSTYRVVINKRSGSSAASYDLYFNITTGYLAFYNGTGYTSSAVPIINAWNHIAAVYDGTNINLYMNGVRVLQSATTNPDNGGNLYIGADENGSSNYFIGYVSNVRIVKGTAVYTSNFVPPVAPVTVITNTSLLLNMTSAGVYDSTMINDLETVGDAKILSTQTPYAGSYYSNYFDGVDDYLSYTSSTTLNFGTGDFTVECWINLGNTTGSKVIIGGTATNSFGLRYGTAYGSNNGLNIYRSNFADLEYCSFSFLPNVWYHVAVVRQSNVIKYFVNGNQQTTVGSGGSLYNWPTETTVRIGTSDNGSEDYIGYISNLRVVKGTAVYTSNFTPSTTPLSATQSSGTNISAITGTQTSLLTCQSNRFIDNSTNAFAITKYGDTAVQSFNPFQRNSATTMYFDGTGDYLYSPPSVNYAMGSGDFTIEFWYYPVSQNAAWNPNIMGNYNTTWTTNKWAIHAPHSTAAGKYSFWVNNIATQPLLASTSNVTNGAWVHIAITRSASTWRMFINGSIQATATSSAALDGGTAASMDGLYIGANFYSGEGGRYINAYINDLRITKGVARYTSTFTPPTSAFLTT